MVKLYFRHRGCTFSNSISIEIEMLEWAALNTSCCWHTLCQEGINLSWTRCWVSVCGTRLKWYLFIDFWELRCYTQYGGFSRVVMITPQRGSSLWQSSPWAGDRCWVCEMIHVWRCTGTPILLWGSTSSTGLRLSIAYWLFVEQNLGLTARRRRTW